MDRRRFLVTSGIGAAATLLTPKPAFAAKKFRWRMVLAAPKTLPVWGPGMLRFAETVEKLSDGALRIKVYGAGELVPGLGTFDAVKAGQVEMGHAAAYYWFGKIPAAAFFTSVPFGMNAEGNLAWIHAGGGQELYDELMKPHGVICFPCGGTGYQMGGWFNREINALEDLNGLKMRIPGLAATVLSRAGVKPVLLPAGDIFTGLSTGVIDAVEWVGPYHDSVMGFHKAAKYYYGSGWHEAGPLLELMIHQKSWNELPENLRQIVKLAASDTTVWMHAHWNAKNGEYLQKLRAEGKVSIRQFPAPVLAKLKEISEDVKKELAGTSPLAKRIYDSYTGFQRQYDDYTELAGGFYPG